MVQAFSYKWLDISQVCFVACLWTDTQSRSINTGKKGQHRAILIECTWLIKDLLSGVKKTTLNLEQARWSHFARPLIART